MTPLISENQWLGFLDQFGSWVPPLLKTYILTPHPDDETLGVGGIIYDLIKKGVDVTLIAVTDGENAYTNFPHLRAVRIKEQNRALAILGLPEDKIVRLALIDSDVQSSETLLQQTMENLIVEPSSIFSTWNRDFHPDHEAVGRVALHIAIKTKSYLNYYFFWTWHRGTFDVFANLPLGIYHLNPEAYFAKQQAIQAYRSQLESAQVEPILTDLYLLPTKRKHEVILPYVF